MPITTRARGSTRTERALSIATFEE